MSDERLYYRIGEVAREAGVETHVLRYWETEFPLLKPKKTGSGQRIYTPRDVELVLHIRDLLHREKYTISGARKRLARERRWGKDPASPGDAVPEDTQKALNQAVAELRSLLDMLGDSR